MSFVEHEESCIHRPESNNRDPDFNPDQDFFRFGDSTFHQPGQWQAGGKNGVHKSYQTKGVEDGMMLMYMLQLT